MIDKKDHITKILYVEDDPDIRTNIEKLLKRRYDLVEVREDGIFGLEAYNLFKPDIVITDILMPRMSGLEMAEKIRENDSDIPIIVTTAHSDSEHLVKSIEIGITHYVLKPIDLHKFFDFIDKSKKIIHIERELFESITETSVSGIFVFKENFTYTNQEFQNITGFKEEELLGKCFSEVFHDEFKRKAQSFVKKVKNQEALDSNFFEGKLETKDKKIKWVYVAINSIIHKEEFIGTGSIIDITQRKELQEKLLAQAKFDNLTGAINRHSFAEIYLKEEQRSSRNNSIASLIILDIDFFKKVNDTHGHLVGDYILKEITKIVSNTLRDVDSFVRWGGEEFIIFAPETDVNGATLLAEKIRKLIEDYKFDIVGHITVSLGVTEKKPDDKLEKLIDRADKFLYQAKESGRNKVISG